MRCGAVRSYLLSPLILRSVQCFSSTFSQLEEERAEHSAKKLKIMEEHMELLRTDMEQRREESKQRWKESKQRRKESKQRWKESKQRRKESKLLNRCMQLQSHLLMALLQREGGVSVANRLADDDLLSDSDSDDDD